MGPVSEKMKLPRKKKCNDMTTPLEGSRYCYVKQAVKHYL